MKSMTSQVTAVKNYLKSQWMNVDEEWISGCVEYLTENESYTLSEIQNLAKEQWLLNDLKEICPGCLPANLKEQAKVELNGRFIVQINAAIDIGTPAFQQYLKLQKVNLENIEETANKEDKISNHRMIKLYLTDGVQEVSGIEYKPIRNLSYEITPGSKMLLKGPIECRRGVMLLTEGMIELLGGEVQEISADNCLAQLLARKLDLPVPRDEPNTTISIARNSNIPTLHSEMPSSHDIALSNLSDHSSRPVARVTSLQIAENNPNNHLGQSRSMGQSHPVGQSHTMGQSHPMGQSHTMGQSHPEKQNGPRNDFENIEEDFDLNQIEALEAEFNSPITNKRSLDSLSINPQKKIKIDNRNIERNRYSDSDIKKPCSSTSCDLGNNPNDYPDDGDLFADEDDDYLREIESKLDANDSQSNANVKRSISSEPFVYIKQINALKSAEKSGMVFRVKGQILKLLSKLSVGKEGWSLRCTIIDGTGSLDVDFTSDVLSKLVGYTPSEMNKLKKEMANKPEIRERVVSALQKARESLQVLYCIIEVTILDTAKISALLPFDTTHALALDRRLNNV